MAKDANGNKIPKAPKAPAASTFDEDFADPSAGGSFVAAESIGKLLLISPTGMSEEINTTNGPATPLIADVVILTNAKGKALAEPEEIEDALIFQKVLVSTLKGSINKNRVLGRLIADEKRKKPGQSAPYVLELATDADKVIARAYLKSKDPFAA